MGLNKKQWIMFLIFYEGVEEDFLEQMLRLGKVGRSLITKKAKVLMDTYKEWISYEDGAVSGVIKDTKKAMMKDNIFAARVLTSNRQCMNNTYVPRINKEHARFLLSRKKLMSKDLMRINLIGLDNGDSLKNSFEIATQITLGHSHYLLVGGEMGEIERLKDPYRIFKNAVKFAITKMINIATIHMAMTDGEVAEYVKVMENAKRDVWMGLRSTLHFETEDLFYLDTHFLRADSPHDKDVTKESIKKIQTLLDKAMENLKESGNMSVLPTYFLSALEYLKKSSKVKIWETYYKSLAEDKKKYDKELKFANHSYKQGMNQSFLSKKMYESVLHDLENLEKSFQNLKQVKEVHSSLDEVSPKLNDHYLGVIAVSFQKFMKETSIYYQASVETFVDVINKLVSDSEFNIKDYTHDVRENMLDDSKRKSSILLQESLHLDKIFSVMINNMYGQDSEYLTMSKEIIKVLNEKDKDALFKSRQGTMGLARSDVLKEISKEMTLTTRNLEKDEKKLIEMSRAHAAAKKGKRHRPGKQLAIEEVDVTHERSDIGDSEEEDNDNKNFDSFDSSNVNLKDDNWIDLQGDGVMDEIMSKDHLKKDLVKFPEEYHDLIDNKEAKCTTRRFLRDKVGNLMKNPSFDLEDCYILDRDLAYLGIVYKGELSVEVKKISEYLDSPNCFDFNKNAYVYDSKTHMIEDRNKINEWNIKYKRSDQQGKTSTKAKEEEKGKMAGLPEDEEVNFVELQTPEEFIKSKIPHFFDFRDWLSKDTTSEELEEVDRFLEDYCEYHHYVISEKEGTAEAWGSSENMEFINMAKEKRSFYYACYLTMYGTKMIPKLKQKKRLRESTMIIDTIGNFGIFGIDFATADVERARRVVTSSDSVYKKDKFDTKFHFCTHRSLSQSESALGLYIQNHNSLKATVTSRFYAEKMRTKVTNNPGFIDFVERDDKKLNELFEASRYASMCLVSSNFVKGLASKLAAPGRTCHDLILTKDLFDYYNRLCMQEKKIRDAHFQDKTCTIPQIFSQGYLNTTFETVINQFYINSAFNIDIIDSKSAMKKVVEKFLKAKLKMDKLSKSDRNIMLSLEAPLADIKSLGGRILKMLRYSGSSYLKELLAESTVFYRNQNKNIFHRIENKALSERPISDLGKSTNTLVDFRDSIDYDKLKQNIKDNLNIADLLKFKNKIDGVKVREEFSNLVKSVGDNNLLSSFVKAFKLNKKDVLIEDDNLTEKMKDDIVSEAELACKCFLEGQMKYDFKEDVVKKNMDIVEMDAELQEIAGQVNDSIEGLDGSVDHIARASLLARMDELQRMISAHYEVYLKNNLLNLVKKLFSREMVSDLNFIHKCLLEENVDDIVDISAYFQDRMKSTLAKKAISKPSVNKFLFLLSANASSLDLAVRDLGFGDKLSRALGFKFIKQQGDKMSDEDRVKFVLLDMLRYQYNSDIKGFFTLNRFNVSSYTNPRSTSTTSMLMMLDSMNNELDADIFTTFFSVVKEPVCVDLGISYKRQKGCNRNLSLGTGLGKIIMRVGEEPCRTYTSFMPTSCLNNKQNEIDFKSRVKKNMSGPTIETLREEDFSKGLGVTATDNDSHDASKWADNHVSLAFKLVLSGCDLPYYKELIDTVLNMHFIKRFEIPRVFIESVMSDVIHYGEEYLDDSQTYVHEILKENKLYVQHLIDMGQGIPHNMSDMYGNIVRNYASELASLSTCLTYKEDITIVKEHQMNTSDDHAAQRNWSFKKFIEVEGRRDISTYYLNRKYAFQNLMNCTLSQKSVTASKIIELKSDFLPQSRQNTPTIKQSMSSVFVHPDMKLSDFHSTACSFSQDILSNNGNLVMIQAQMCHQNHRRSHPYSLMKGGMNRIYNDFRQFSLLPQLGGFPSIGLGALYCSVVDVSVYIQMLKLCSSNRQANALLKTLKIDYSNPEAFQSTLQLIEFTTTHKLQPRSKKIDKVFLAAIKQHKNDSSHLWLEDFISEMYSVTSIEGVRRRLENSLDAIMKTESGEGGAVLKFANSYSFGKSRVYIDNTGRSCSFNDKIFFEKPVIGAQTLEPMMIRDLLQNNYLTSYTNLEAIVESDNRLCNLGKEFVRNSDYRPRFRLGEYIQVSYNPSPALYALLSDNEYLLNFIDTERLSEGSLTVDKHNLSRIMELLGIKVKTNKDIIREKLEELTSYLQGLKRNKDFYIFHIAKKSLEEVKDLDIEKVLNPKILSMKTNKESKESILKSKIQQLRNKNHSVAQKVTDQSNDEMHESETLEEQEANEKDLELLQSVKKGVKIDDLSSEDQKDLKNLTKRTKLNLNPSESNFFLSEDLKTLFREDETLKIVSQKLISYANKSLDKIKEDSEKDLCENIDNTINEMIERIKKVIWKYKSNLQELYNISYREGANTSIYNMIEMALDGLNTDVLFLGSRFEDFGRISIMRFREYDRRESSTILSMLRVFMSRPSFTTLPGYFLFPDGYTIGEKLINLQKYSTIPNVTVQPKGAPILYTMGDEDTRSLCNKMMRIMLFYASLLSNKDGIVIDSWIEDIYRVLPGFSNFLLQPSLSAKRDMLKSAFKFYFQIDSSAKSLLMLLFSNRDLLVFKRGLVTTYRKRNEHYTINREMKTKEGDAVTNITFCDEIDVVENPNNNSVMITYRTDDIRLKTCPKAFRMNIIEKFLKSLISKKTKLFESMGTHHSDFFEEIISGDRNILFHTDYPTFSEVDIFSVEHTLSVRLIEGQCIISYLNIDEDLVDMTDSQKLMSLGRFLDAEIVKQKSFNEVYRESVKRRLHMMMRLNQEDKNKLNMFDKADSEVLKKSVRSEASSSNNKSSGDSQQLEEYEEGWEDLEFEEEQEESMFEYDEDVELSDGFDEKDFQAYKEKKKNVEDPVKDFLKNKDSMDNQDLQEIYNNAFNLSEHLADNQIKNGTNTVVLNIHFVLSVSDLIFMKTILKSMVQHLRDYENVLPFHNFEEDCYFSKYVSEKVVKREMMLPLLLEEDQSEPYMSLAWFAKIQYPMPNATIFDIKLKKLSLLTTEESKFANALFCTKKCIKEKKFTKSRFSVARDMYGKVNKKSLTDNDLIGMNKRYFAAEFEPGSNLDLDQYGALIKVGFLQSSKGDRWIFKDTSDDEEFEEESSEEDDEEVIQETPADVIYYRDYNSLRNAGNPENGRTLKFLFQIVDLDDLFLLSGYQEVLQSKKFVEDKYNKEGISDRYVDIKASESRKVNVLRSIEANVEES
jgi:hypothetical protein